MKKNATSRPKELIVVKEEPRGAPRPKPRVRTAPPPSSTGPRDAGQNDFLFSRLNPRLAKDRGIGIPDACLPTTKFQTKARVACTVDGSGNSSYCFTPALTHGVLRLGTNASGGVTTMTSSTGTELSAEGYTAAGYAPAAASNLVSQADLTDILSSSVGIRPVSMQVDYTPTANITLEAGLLNVRHCARDQPPGRPDVNVTAESLGQMFGPGPINIGQIASDQNSFESRASQRTSAYWMQQDNKDSEFVPIAGPGAISTDPATVYNNVNVGWREVRTDCLVTSNTDTMYLNNEPIVVAMGTDAGGSVTTNTVLSRGKPYVQFTFSGTQATAATTTTIGVFEIYINWETLSDGSRVVDHSTANVNNPLEIAQADNVASMLPMLSYPDNPGDPVTKVQRAGAAAITHLYDDRIPRKRAIEGTSWLGDFLKKHGPSVAGTLASLIPGFGQIAAPLATSGAAYLASMFN